MRILIIEDENPAASRLKRLIAPLLEDAEIFGNLDSVKSAIDWLSFNEIPDLIFCDIQLADGISFEIFEKVPVSCPIIFTTAFDQYAIQAFDVNAIDYLLKPLDPAAVEKAVQKFKAKQIKPSLDLSRIQDFLAQSTQKFKKRFLVKFGEKIQSINTTDVSFFFSESKITYLQTFEGKRYVVDSKLEKVESEVDPTLFFRINRKYLIHPDSIIDIFIHSNSRLKIKLNHCKDSDIIVSREKVSAFKEWLDN